MSQLKISHSTLFEDIKIIAPDIFSDARGEFVETYSMEKYAFKNKAGETLLFKEDDISTSKKNVLRGLHGNYRTWKLIQCLYGEVYVAIVNFDKSSAHYLKSEYHILNDKNRLQILIPPGYANGYLCLSEHCVFSYKQTEYYSGQEEQFALRWNDPMLDLTWPVEQPVLSQRDSEAIDIAKRE